MRSAGNRAVEEQLVERVGSGRGTRLAITYADEFPEMYRHETDPADAAEDILRLAKLEDDRQRIVRLYKAAGGREQVERGERDAASAVSGVLRVGCDAGAARGDQGASG